MNIREQIEASAEGVERRIQEDGGEEAYYRRRIREMAENGDLYAIGRILNAFARGHTDSILSPVSKEVCAVERGALMGLRSFWWNLLRYGEDDLPEEVPYAEMNPFAELSELDRS